MSLAQENYDEALAKKLGADEFGMKKYVIAFLYRGDPVSEYSEVKRSEIQKGHMANITQTSRGRKDGFCRVIFLEIKKREVYSFSPSEVLKRPKVLTESGLAVKAGVLKTDQKEWNGSASLGMVVEISEKIAKNNF